MSNRLDKEREVELQPKRVQAAIDALINLNVGIVMANETTIKFIWKDEVVTFFPYSGWHTGKTIKDGRGLSKLLKQLK